MKKLFLSAVVLALCAAFASAAQINVKVTTDSATYNVGNTVQWTLTAWTDSTTDGVALLGVTLTEDRSEVMTAALTTGSAPFKSLRGSFTVAGTHATYDVNNGFLLDGAGTPNAGGLLADILVHQTPDRAEATLDVGNDGLEHIFAIGSFTANAVGVHHLTPTLTGANYWPLNTGASMAFESSALTQATYTVNAIPEPATLCLVGLGLAGIAGLRRRMKK